MKLFTSAFWRGFASVLTLSPRTYCLPQVTVHRRTSCHRDVQGFAADSQALAGDWAKIGGDMQRALDRVAKTLQ